MGIREKAKGGLKCCKLVQRTHRLVVRGYTMFSILDVRTCGNSRSVRSSDVKLPRHVVYIRERENRNDLLVPDRFGSMRAQGESKPTIHYLP